MLKCSLRQDGAWWLLSISQDYALELGRTYTNTDIERHLVLSVFNSQTAH